MKTKTYVGVKVVGAGRGLSSRIRLDNPAAPKSLVPWLASQTDMLAEDWTIIL